MDKYCYHAIAYTEGKFWVIKFPDYPDLTTQAKGFKELELMAKDLINLAHEIPIDRIEFAVTLYFDDDFMTDDLREFSEYWTSVHKNRFRSVLKKVKSLYSRNEAERVIEND